MTRRTPPHADIAETFATASKTKEIDATSAPAKPSLGIDAEYYQSFLDDYDIPDAQKRELIEALWAIIVQFIDLGFGVHPITSIQGQQQTDETLRALKAVARDFASDAFEDNQMLAPILTEELAIADYTGSALSHTQDDTRTERSET